MQVQSSKEKKARFIITAADAPDYPIIDGCLSSAYDQLIMKIREVNKYNFSDDDEFSIFPRHRLTQDNIYGLNGPQFFGFGVNEIRKALECKAGAEACIVPLSSSSISYRFCFKNPAQEALMDLQRKRAAALSEKELQNISGCARTEGMGAVDKSVGSGRITRALVKRAPDDFYKANVKNETSEQKYGLETKSEIDTNQKKYEEMKSIPFNRRLSAKRSHIHGWGLFTKVDLSKDDMIIEYMGETVGQCIADKREIAYEKSGIGSCYMFRLDSSHIVDATMIGCMARFMNHCCSANAYAKVITINTDKTFVKKIVVFANQNIKAGDEITYDYKFPVEDGSLKCTCGAPNCIGRLN
eukprot:CAMPEP_0184871294 /NCGR_PEP_ID=MMETSP0580-20130426/40634_1 /TAXON_ID=1118495 /ORGANISM="Dactyliosolen fragilissimus" /LENGTH=354 /DNA_ID=CAMNT_0027373937 /DNA_START=1661 /DNA_END=2725 /DNA_ORIENTATION=+